MKKVINWWLNSCFRLIALFSCQGIIINFLRFCDLQIFGGFPKVRRLQFLGSDNFEKTPSFHIFWIISLSLKIIFAELSGVPLRNLKSCLWNYATFHQKISKFMIIRAFLITYFQKYYDIPSLWAVSHF